MPVAPDRVHATAIALDDRAVLIRGPSGSGKSDLALRCLCLNPVGLIHGTVHLVADDQVLLRNQHETLVARAPDTLRGKLEVRGIGIIACSARDDVPVRLIADLVAPGQVERLPEVSVITLGSVQLPHLLITPFEQSAPLKLLLALAFGRE